MILNLQLDEEDTLKEFGTLSGFLCMCAGEIPKVGDFIVSRGWSFEIVEADPKKILTVKVERLIGFYEDEDGEDDKDSMVPFLQKGKSKVASKDDESTPVEETSGDVMLNLETEVQAETIGSDIIITNNEEANRIDVMVKDQEKKRSYVKDMITEMNETGGTI